MSKRHYDDDSEEMDVKPGDIDDLFENSELEVNESDMLDINDSIETDADEDWKEYMADEDSETDPIMETSKEEQPEEQSWVEHTEEQIKEALEESAEVTSEELADAILDDFTGDTLSVVNVAEEEPTAEEVKDDFIERKDEIAKDPEVVDMNNKTPSEEQTIIDELLDSTTESEIKSSEETEIENIEEDSIDKIIEDEERKEIENSPEEPAEETEIEEDLVDQVMESVDEEKEEEESEEDEIETLEENNDFQDVKDDSDEERTNDKVDVDKIIKGPHESVESDEFDLNRNQHFKDHVKEILEKFPPAKISDWLKSAKEGGEEELDILKDFYIKEYAFYNGYIDFTHPNAKADLWTIVAYDYYKLTSWKNASIEGTSVESEKRPDGLSGDGTLIENEYSRNLKERKKVLEEKYRKYKLDRTFFHISEDEEECSIFEVRKSLMDEFVSSVFYNIHKEVLTSDAVFDMSKIHANIIINEQTHTIPIIDYSTGIRCICINTSDVNQYHLNAMLISRKIKFSFKLSNGERMRVRILYSDDCTTRSVAIVSMLKKLIGFKYMNKRFITTLNRNYVMAYTTESQYVNMFEYGDPDTNDPGNSTYNIPKTNNMCVGVIVLDKKTLKDRQSMRRNQLRDDSHDNMFGSEDVSASDYNAHFVLSARIIKNDLRLRDPSYMKQERYVEYTIVSITESNAVIINDAMQTICAAIINEHKKKYDPGTNYSISFELNRDNFVSPSIIDMIDCRDGIELSNARRINSPADITHQFILPPSRLKMSGVYDIEKGRLDSRFFSPYTIQHNYPERSLWQNYDIFTQQGRIEFIKSRGFEDFYIPAPIVYDIEPYVLDMLETSDLTRNLIKISVAMLRDKNSDDSEQLLFKQRELNYLKGIDENGKTFGGFQKFLFSVMDYFINGGKE